MRKKKPSLWRRMGQNPEGYFVFALGLGMGATTAVYVGAATMQADLANLLGGILGAGLGAAGGVAGAVVLFERQKQESEEKEHERKRRVIADAHMELTLIGANMEYLARQIEKAQITGSTLTAWYVLEEKVSDVRGLLEVFMELGMGRSDPELGDSYAALAVELPHIRRIARDIVSGGGITVAEMQGETGRQIATEFTKTTRTIEGAKSALLRARELIGQEREES